MGFSFTTAVVVKRNLQLYFAYSQSLRGNSLEGLLLHRCAGDFYDHAITSHMRGVYFVAGLRERGDLNFQAVQRNHYFWGMFGGAP